MESLVDQFVQDYFSELFESNGFRNIKYRGSRWVRYIDQSVFESIQFVPYYSAFEIYYSFQPFFYPLDLPYSRIAYHDRFWSYFNPVADYYAMAPQEPTFTEEPFSSQKAMDRSATYWKNVLEKTVFPLLDLISDAASCCEVHKIRYSRAGVTDLLSLGFNGRYLLECAFMGNWKECERISNRFLLPILQKEGPEHEVFVDYQGAERRKAINRAPIPVGLLVSDIQGTMSVLQKRIADNGNQTAKLVDEIMRKHRFSD